MVSWKQKLSVIRRKILEKLIPEFVWPRTITLEGVEFKVRNTPYSFGIKRMLSRNAERYEDAERHFLKLIKEGDSVLEFGSSIGIVTRLIADRIGSKGQLVAVEASDQLTSYSRTWLETIPTVKVVTGFAFPVYRPIPIQLKFDDSKGSLGGTVMFEKDETKMPSENAFFIEDAEKHFQIQPKVLVCDIEGSEIIFLDEKATLPEYLKTIMIELHPGMYGLHTAIEIIDKLKTLGYSLQYALHSVYVFQQNET